MIAVHVDEVPQFQATHVGDETRQECIAGDVEGHPEAQATGSLVQLTGELSVSHIELGKDSRQRGTVSDEGSKERCFLQVQ